MAIDSNLVKLALDGYKGHVAGDYSVNDTQEALRKALVEANGGSTKLTLRLCVMAAAPRCSLLLRSWSMLFLRKV